MTVRVSDVTAHAGIPFLARPGRAHPQHSWHSPALLIGAAAYLSLNLYRFFRVPFLLGGDQVFFWMYAQRMLAGEKIYRDFFQFTPPGTDLIYFTSFKLFGPHIWVTNAIVLALGLALCWICFSIASEIMDRSTALLAAALFLVFIYGKLLSGTHHFFSVAAIMCALKLMMGRMTLARSISAGFLLGLASFFTQSHGFVALFALLLFLSGESLKVRSLAGERLRNSGLLLLGYSAVLFLLSAHWIFTEGLAQLWRFQVTYVHEHVSLEANGTFLGLPPVSGTYSFLKLSQYIAVYLLIAIVYPLTLWLCWCERRRPHVPIRQLSLLSVVGIALLLEMASNLNWLRVYAVSMPAVIVFVWFITRNQAERRIMLRATWIAVGFLAMSQTLGHYRAQKTIVRLPAGVAAVDPIARDKLEWVMHHSTPGDYFFQAAWPGLYLPLALRNPIYFESVEPADRLLPSDVSSIIAGLERKQVAYILWARRLDFRGQSTNASRDNLESFRVYIHSRYTVVENFADGDSVLKRDDKKNAKY